MRMTLPVLRHLPDGFLTTPANKMIDILAEPTLFDLPGRIEQPLFVSVLLHGNEDTGLLALQDVLKRHKDHGLPRRLLLFVGNVQAAAEGVRTLEGQVDYNRAWQGTPNADTSEGRLMSDVYRYVAQQKPFVSIDIHNNTGLNPHYACLNRLDARFLHLARLFSRQVVFFEEPVGVQSAAMAEICPSVTVECGKMGERSATLHATEFVEAALALTEFPTRPPQAADYDIMRTFAIVKVPPEISFSFDGSNADIKFRNDIDHLNFSELASGTLFGSIRRELDVRLDLTAGTSEPLSEYFDYSGGKIRLIEPAIPSMLTRDIQAVRLDCLCYLMHRIDFKGRRLTET